MMVGERNLKELDNRTEQKLKERKIKEKTVTGGEEQEEGEMRVELGVRRGDLVT